MTIKRILIDCSDTYTYNLHTGIQRVVRSIVERKELIENVLDVSVIPVVLTRFGYISLSDFQKQNQKKNENKKTKSLKQKAQEFITTKLRSSLIYSSVKYLWYVYSKIYYLFIEIVNIFLKKPNNIILPSENDLLFLIDAFWQPIYTQNKSFFEIIRKTKHKKALFAVLIYDIIPITNPQFCGYLFANTFKTSFHEIVKYSDFIITISQSEKTIIENYLNSMQIKIPIDYFYLGSDLSKYNQLQFVRQEIKLLATKPYYLMVGTLEPRKGYDTALKAFESLWNNGFNENLIIIGKIGDKMEKIIEEILNSNYYKQKLFMFNDANDAELEFLYQNTKALIFASKREGFGLPLVEAMQRKIPIIASNIEVFREIAKDYPIYFDPDDHKDLSKTILTFQKNLKSTQNNFKPLSWDDSVKMLCMKLKLF